MSIPFSETQSTPIDSGSQERNDADENAPLSPEETQMDAMGEETQERRTEKNAESAARQEEDGVDHAESDESYLEFEPVSPSASDSGYGLRETSHPSATAHTEQLSTDERSEESAGVEVVSLAKSSSQPDTGKKTATRAVSFRDDRAAQLPQHQVQELLRSMSASRVASNSDKHRPAKPTKLHSCTSSKKASRAKLQESGEAALTDSSIDCSAASNGSFVKQASKELLRLLSNPDLADDVAVECAEKALERYISPVMEQHELRVIMETEKALEEELLGLDKELIERIPKEVDERLNRRAKAVAAAETVAGSASSHTLSKQGSHHRHSSSTELRPTNSNPTPESREDSTGCPLVTSPRPSEAPSRSSVVGEVEKVPMTKLQAQLSRRFASSKHLDLANLTAVYDRNFSWLKRHEYRIEEAQRMKHRQCMKECSFQPNASLQRTKPEPSGESEATTVNGGGLDLSKTDQACLRLYKKAREMHAKQYQKTEQFIYDEQQALLASSPRPRPLPLGVYGHLFPSPRSLPRPFATKLRPLPSGKPPLCRRSLFTGRGLVGVEECTFHPKTNIKRTWTTPSRTRQGSFWSLADFRYDFCGPLRPQRMHRMVLFSSSLKFVEDATEAPSVDSIGRSSPNAFEAADPKEEQEKSTTQRNTLKGGPVLAITENENAGLWKCAENDGDVNEVEEGEEGDEWIRQPSAELMHAFFEHFTQQKDDRATNRKRHKGVGMGEREDGYHSDGRELNKNRRWKTAGRMQLTQHAGTARLMTDVDFAEFLKRCLLPQRGEGSTGLYVSRQQDHLFNKDRKIKALRDRKEPNFELAPGTKRILKDRKAQLIAARSDAETLMPYYSTASEGRPVSALEYIQPSSNGNSKHRRRSCVAVDTECSFSPRITKKAQRLGRRTVEDFLRRSEKAKFMREAQRLENELKEHMHLTFKPKLNKNRKVPSRLNLKNPEAYMETIRRRQLEKQRKEIKATEEREAAELMKCTFQPRTTSLPSCIKKELERKHYASRLEDSIPAYPTWGYALKFQTERLS